MLLFLSVTAILAVLLLVLWIVRGGAKVSFGEQTCHSLYPVDVPALRNLLAQDEDDFLRSMLITSAYRKVRRARVRAMQEYLLWISANCATLLAILRLKASAPELASASGTEMLVRNALKLRTISIGFWALLWVEFFLPDLKLRPATTVKQYEEVRRLAEGYFRTHLVEPTTFVHEAIG